MRKKCLILLAAVLIGLSFHACSLPDSINQPKKIKIKGSPDYDLLLNVTGIDLGRIYIDMLQEQLAKIGSDQLTTDVWEVNYGQKQKEQTFLLKLSMTLTNSLDPGTYLNRAGFKDNDFVSAEPFEIDCKVDTTSIGINQTVEIDISSLLTAGTQAGDFVTLPTDIVMQIPDTTIPENTTGFLHARIEEVEFEITSEENPGGSVLTGGNPEFTFDAQQVADGPYSGLTDSNLSPGALKNRDINKKELIFSGGKIKIHSGTTFEISQNDIATQKKKLTVTMNIKKLMEVNWDFTTISDEFEKDSAVFPPYSLAEPARYVRELDFDVCDEKGERGIGLKARFNKVISGLSLAVSCDDIGVHDVTNDLVENEDIIFGNKDGKENFELENYKDDAELLEYKITLKPASSTNVLEIGELTLGEPLEIKGNVEFFHVWTRAVLDMKEIIKIAEMTDDDFMGAVPNVFKEGNPEKPIDLSFLKNYFEGGVTIDGITTDIYLSGPKGAFDPRKLPGLEFSAKLVPPEDELVGEPLGGEPLYKGPLLLGHPPSLPPPNEYYRSENLPVNGMEINNAPFTKLMEIILNEAPENLFFQYDLIMEEYLEITSEAFYAYTNAGEEENDVITVDALVLLPLKLRATGDDGLRFLFNEFIGEQTDLFGREKPGEKTDFSSMKMPALHVSLEFPAQIFSGGTIKLFTDHLAEVGEETEEETEVVVEKERGFDPLFPNGIPLNGKNGKSIDIYVSGDKLNKVLGTTEESKLLILNPLIEFDKGNTITIPRNAGLMRIKLGFSGNYELDPKDLGL
jgi:hypothetical protein